MAFRFLIDTSRARFIASLTCLFMVAGPALANDYVHRNCHCRTATSELVEVGNITCIKTNEGLREARCEFVLNNTAWKLTGNLCPLTQNQLSGDADRFSSATLDFSSKQIR
ncbi:MAG: hypothetical protein H2045_08710 [Rhizobiales bacterium]|nr:hypothetical protein [Hyphomicrobiales bacterium]